MRLLSRLLALVLAASALLTSAETVSIKVQADQPGARINSSMWGVFFEDINFGADGGLNAELVKNGSFEFPDPRMGWKRIGGKAAEDTVLFMARADESPANRRLVEIRSDGKTVYGLTNEGFRGIGVRSGDIYDLSLDARTVSGGPITVRVELVGPNGVIATTRIGGLTSSWQKFTATLSSESTEFKASLSLVIEGAGTVLLDRVSLFPRKTWKNRPQGLRADMVQMLADMKPGFVRFPGGCIVEGKNLEGRYEWKKTILPREERVLLFNRWNNEMKNAQAPDYYQSFGLGFFELFQLCDDLGSEPLPIINCGMACQWNSGELAPLETLQPYIQDALDLIEFANGPVTSTWGAKRAALGHPAPFKMKMLGIGNEQWGPQYVERFAAFSKVLREKHPEIQLIAAGGWEMTGAQFDYLMKQWRQIRPDFVDEHSYATPSWFLERFNRYDSVSRNDPKIFVGEFAAHTKDRRNSLEAALAEAVFMLGMERNADQVRMASYAPLFAHIDAAQWAPDLIWNNNLQVMATPNYYVQQLFSLNRGDVVIPAAVSSPAGGKLFTSATKDEGTGELIIKVVNIGEQVIEAQLSLEGLKATPSSLRRIVLSGKNPEAVNSFDDPRQLTPVETVEKPFSATQSFAPYSLTVLRVPTQ